MDSDEDSFNLSSCNRSADSSDDDNNNKDDDDVDDDDNNDVVKEQSVDQPNPGLAVGEVAPLLGKAVHQIWLKKKVPIEHVFSKAGWILSSAPEVMKYCDDNTKSHHKWTMNDIINMFLRLDLQSNHVMSQILNKFWTEWYQWRPCSAPHYQFGYIFHSLLLKGKQPRSCEWHFLYTRPDAEVLETLLSG